MATWQIVLIAVWWIGCGVGPLLAWQLALPKAFTLFELIAVVLFGTLFGPLPLIAMSCQRVVLRKAKTPTTPITTTNR